MTTPAPTTEAPAATPAPAPAAPTGKPTAEQVLADFDAEYLAATAAPAEEPEEPATPPAKAPEKTEPAKDEPAVEEPAEEPEGGQKADEEVPVPDDGEWEEGIVPPKPEETLPSKERAALKAIKDPAIRRAFARDHYIVKAYESSGMRIGDVRRYIAAAPTPEALEERVTRAEQLDAFVDDFATAGQDRKAAMRVADVLRETNAEGFTGVVDLVLDNLHVVRPTRMREIADRFLRAGIANMRRDAEESGDLVLADHADGMETYFGLKTAKGRPGNGRDKAPVDPEVERKLKAADEVLEREREREAQQGRQRYAAFEGTVVKDAVTQAADFAKDWIEENCGAYSNEVKAELFNQLHTTVRGHVEGNAVIAKTLRRLIDEGVGDEAHRQRCNEYLVKAIKSVFVAAAPEVLTKIQRIAGPAIARRAERAAHARSARDVGGAGAPAVAPEKVLSGKHKHAEDVLKEFDALT